MGAFKPIPQEPPLEHSSLLERLSAPICVTNLAPLNIAERNGPEPDSLDRGADISWIVH
jgi:hypothetical protein